MINLANLLTVKGAEDFLLSLTIADFLAFSSWAMILTAVPTFFMLLFITAPYGRYSTAGRWGPLVPARFGWFVMESPNLWMTILVSIFLGQANSTAPTEIALSLFLLHYTNRSIIFPLRLKKPTAMTFAVMASAFCYCCWNGFNQAVSLIVVNPLPAEKIQDPFFWLGVILFFVGFILNIHADTVLMNLRKETDKPGSYRIPYGGLFQYISCPNYAGEILEWFGFACACGWSIPSTAFVIYTFANLAPRALKHHQWYREKFPREYPKNRKALIPFLM